MSLFLRLFIRYAIAIVVACMVSSLSFQLAMDILFWHWVMFLVRSSAILDNGIGIGLLALNGFAFVFSGTFCLKRSSRRYGSLFLFIAGLGIFIYYRLFLEYYDNDNPLAPLRLLVDWPFMAGGIMAVLFFWFRKPGNIVPEVVWD